MVRNLKKKDFKLPDCKKYQSQLAAYLHGTLRLEKLILNLKK